VVEPIVEYQPGVLGLPVANVIVKLIVRRLGGGLNEDVAVVVANHRVIKEALLGLRLYYLLLYLSYYLDLASGAAIILVATALFFLTLASPATCASSLPSPESRRIL